MYLDLIIGTALCLGGGIDFTFPCGDVKSMVEGNVPAVGHCHIGVIEE